MPCSNVIIPSCHYASVFSCVSNSIWSPHLWKPDWRTASPGNCTAKTKKLPLLYQRDRRQGKPSNNVGNVSFYGRSEFHGDMLPSIWPELKDLNICACRLPFQSMFILFICSMSKWGEATLNTCKSIKKIVPVFNISEQKAFWKLQSDFISVSLQALLSFAIGRIINPTV